MNLFIYFQSKMTIILIYFILEHFYIWLWVEVTCNEIWPMLLCTQDQWLTARSCQSVPSRWWPWAWSHPCRWRPWPDGGVRTGWGPLTWPPSAAQSWTAWSPQHPPVDYPVHKIQNNVILLGLWFYIALYRIGTMTSYCSNAGTYT